MSTELQLLDQNRNRVDVVLEDDGTFSFKVTLNRKYTNADIPSIIKAMRWKYPQQEHAQPQLKRVK